MQSRTNLIVSLGGRHGKGGTYLRGAQIDPKTSEQVPNRLITGNTREAWAGQGVLGQPGAKAKGHQARKAKAKAALKGRTATNEGVAADALASPEAQALLDAVRKDEAAEAKAKGRKSRDAEVMTTPPPLPMGLKELKEEPKTEESKVEGPKDPTSRRQLTAMRKDELIALATRVGVDSDGKASDIRGRLKTYFFEDDDVEE